MKNRIITGIFFVSLMLLPAGVFAAFSENSRQGLPAISVTSQPGSTDESAEPHQGCGLRLRIFTADSLFGFNGGYNLFAYANQNPLRYVDSDGKTPAILAWLLAREGLVLGVTAAATLAARYAVWAGGVYAGCDSLPDQGMKAHLLPLPYGLTQLHLVQVHPSECEMQEFINKHPNGCASIGHFGKTWVKGNCIYWFSFPDDLPNAPNYYLPGGEFER